ncbi:YitT family protein [Blautia hydrogenotrophica]|uniref:YitT family protein n=1 Tax=Blautia hydrogenotrophica TaxID=53443 RepID=UPI002E7A30D8|nr:YitT family protein [Blautia hydrogenotrophica]MEE0463341.1 YitT family protein [Blautia hydrogenotrophica]
MSCAIIAAVIFAVNIKTFVRAGGLYPSGFNGVTLLVQQIGTQFFGIAIPFSLINLPLNAIPAFISFKYLGPKFTVSSCCVVVLTSLLTDFIPSQPITYDPLLISIFGGLINGLAAGLCLIGNTSGGGTDFIAILVSEKRGRDIWNYILAGNAVLLTVAGLLFGWDAALYSIIFQFTCTQTIQILHQRYKKHTLFIVTRHPAKVYEEIKNFTHHSATQFTGKGCYSQDELTLLYSVVSREEAKLLIKKVKEVDPSAFINIIKTDYINGRFYHRTDY